jgi:predicted dehydrogenase
VSVEPVRVAVVGYGYWGPNLVRNLNELPHAEVRWLCDKSDAARDRAKLRYPQLLTTPDFDDVLADDEVDGVIVATPVSTHYGVAKAALLAGKHVFVEKPLAASAREALELGTISSEEGLVLMPGHTFLYSPPVNMIRDLIHAGTLGEIYSISASRVNLGLHQPDASVAWDLGPHDFSILRYWLGEVPSHVAALSRGCILPGTPDVAFINLEHVSGTIAHVELAWLAPSKLRRTTIIGSEKMIVYDDTSNEPVRIFDSGVTIPDPESFGEFKLSYRTGDIVSPRVEAAEPLLLEMDDFCQAIRNGSAPRSSWQLGVDVVRVVEAVDQSLASEGARVPVEVDRDLTQDLLRPSTAF